MEDFSSRYKKYLASVSVRDNIVTRKQILENMINEALILDDVAHKGLDQDSSVEHRLEEIRVQTILLGYANRLTLDTMTISDAELQSEFRRYNTKVHARYVYAPSEDSAEVLKGALESGSTFGALSKSTFSDPGLANNGGDLGYFGWNEMEPALEDFAFSQPVGTISGPLKLSMGYAIVKIEDRRYQPLSSESDYANVKDKLAAAIQKRKITDGLKNVTDHIRRELNPIFDEDGVNALYNAWNTMVNPTGANPEAGSVDVRSRALVTIGNRTWTTGDFLTKLSGTNTRQQKRVKTIEDLKEFVVAVATREVTFQRAINEGMEKDSVVQGQIKIKTEGTLLERWKSYVEDEAGKNPLDDHMLRSQYEKSMQQYVSPPEINVAEILVRTKSEADDIRRHLDRGSSFSALAKEKSIRLWAAARGGELGFGPKSMYGELAETLFHANVNKVLGPCYVDPYWGIFRVLAKHEARQQPFEEAKAQITREITASRRQAAFKSALATLREHAEVSIDEKALSNIVLD